MDLEALFSFFGWLRFLKAQVPKLVGDEVELVLGVPLAWLLLSSSSLPNLAMIPILNTRLV